MKRKFPEQVILDPDEVHRANRAQVALRLGVLPSMVDAMPQRDVEDVLAIMWLESQK